MTPSSRPSEPLSELEARILMVLAGGDLHGYGIAKELEDSDEGLEILPTNLYRRLYELADRGLVAQGEPELDESGRARKNFSLTDAGRAAMAAEAERLATLARRLESHTLPTPETGRD